MGRGDLGLAVNLTPLRKAGYRFIKFKTADHAIQTTSHRHLVLWVSVSSLKIFHK